MPDIVVRARVATDNDAAAALAARLGLRARTPDESDGEGDDESADKRSGESHRTANTAHDWTLWVDDARLTLIRPDGTRLGVDFTTGRTAARQQEHGLARQPLARAIGASRLRRRLGRAPRVIDATGGLGRDAWFIAALGCPVVLIERSPLVHALLESALAHAARTEATAATAARITLRAGDARDWLTAPDSDAADVVYLDPMYPPTRRRAAVTKGMQFLHALVGGDTNGDALLTAALAKADAQVTVKRPVGAPALPGDEQFGGQRTTITSPGTRYDVYLLG